MKLRKFFSKFIISTALLLIRTYRNIPRPHVCRFHPSCSEYAMLKLNEQGISAFGAIILRLLKCNPFSKRRVYLE